MRRLAPVADAVCVLVFVGIGRSVHADGVTLAGMASTSWPFLSGLGVGWAGPWGSGRRGDGLAGGLVASVATVAVGMVLRVVAGQGTAAPFVAVAIAFLGATMLGWRLSAWVVARRRRVVRRRRPGGAACRSTP